MFKLFRKPRQVLVGYVLKLSSHESMSSTIIELTRGEQALRGREYVNMIRDRIDDFYSDCNFDYRIEIIGVTRI